MSIASPWYCTPTEREQDGPSLALLLDELIHRTANDFAAACAEVYLASRLRKGEAIQVRLATLAARMHAFASIQRILQRPSSATLDLGNSLCELCHHHAEARFAEQGAFISLRTCEATVEAAQGWALLMIVSELLTNAARHAFNQAGGIVQIEISVAAEMIACQIRDNGVGRSPGIRSGRTGSTIIEGLARGAQIGFRVLADVPGSGYELRLPRRSSPPPTRL